MKKYFFYIVLVGAFICGIVGCILWCIKASEEIVGIVSICVAYELAIIALFQNLLYKEQGDKYQKEIDQYTKNINEKFWALQNNIYEIQSQMLEMANEKEIPHLRPIIKYYTYPSHKIDIKLNRNNDIFIQEMYGEKIQFSLKANSYRKSFKVCNYGACDIRSIKIKRIETIRHFIDCDESFVVNENEIIDNNTPIMLNKKDYLQFEIPVPISRHDEMPKASVLLDFELENCLGKKYTTKIKYNFVWNYRSANPDRYEQENAEIIEKSMLIENKGENYE